MIRRTSVVLAGVVLAAGGFTGYAWYGTHRDDLRRDTERTCVAAATPAAEAIFSYDYRTFDASVAAGRGFTAGEFATEYASTTATLKATAVRAEAVVQAQVSAIGVIEARDGAVELLVYLNQYRRNANITGEKVDQNRVVLTMVRDDEECKVSQASAI